MSASVLGIDVGTSGVRAAVLDEACRVVDRAATSMAAVGGDPTAPATWWSGVEACLGQLSARGSLADVRAVAADGTSGTVLAVDPGGDPIGPARMYDQPCEDDGIMRAIETHAPADSAARGRTSALARVLLVQDRPGVARVLHQADWIAGRLRGAFDRSDANNALKTGYDPVAQRWPDWVAAAGADPAKLPDVAEPGAPIGPVGSAGKKLGLPASAMVHAGTTDGCASFLATGAWQAGEAVTALGSTLVIKLLSDRPIFAPEYGIYSHRIGETWLVGGASNTGGKVIEHLFSKDRLAELTRSLQPDSPTGLNFYPLVAPGERFPINDPVLAPRLSPRPDSEERFFQAVLEGIAEVEALAYGRLRDLGAPILRSVRSVGGGASNLGWTRIRQRLLGVPFEAAASREACEGTARLVLSRARAA